MAVSPRWPPWLPPPELWLLPLCIRCDYVHQCVRESTKQWGHGGVTAVAALAASSSIVAAAAVHQV